MVTNEQLKPCPFCGAPGSLYPESTGSYAQVMCSECPCEISLGPSSEADAIAAWNRRATEPSRRQELVEDLLGKADDSLPDPDPLF